MSTENGRAPGAGIPPEGLEPRHDSPSFLVVGGPTVVLDIAGLRIVSDPTFDPPGDYGLLRKNRGPAIDPGALADVDVVLVSHANHADNLDERGRAFALEAPALITNPGSASILGPGARALEPWQTLDLGAGISVTAVPALHGPADGAPDERGWVNCEVTGFVLDAPGERIYFSGDNTSFAHIRDVKDRFGGFTRAVLHAGRASVPEKFNGRSLSLSAERASAAAQVLGAPHVVVAHQSGWAHFLDGPEATRRAFSDAGIAEVLDDAPEGRWTSR